MISHLVKLIWNKKKAHALVILEIWASFMVLFGLTSLIVINGRNYREPLGFAYENVWAVDINTNQDTTQLGEKTQRIIQRVNAYPEVVSVSRMSNNSPFSANTMNNAIEYAKAKVMADNYITDDDFAKTLAIPLVAGNWYKPADSVGKYIPAVLNQKAKEALFGDENALGKVVSNKYKIVGVIDNFKAKGEFMPNQPAVFEQMSVNDGNRRLLVKVKSGTDAIFEAKLVKAISSMAHGWSVDIDQLTDSRENQHKLTLVPVIIALIVCSFLLINVALGLFGVLNLSIARRRGEIGLRRAIGATGRGISSQFIGEIWVLATFAMLIGLLFAIQFPLLNVFDVQVGVYLTAIGLAALIIYAIVTLCALFPSRQAALIQPAMALHEE